MEKIYLDTSVPSAYYDKENPERQRMTKEFWKKLREYEVYISEIVLKELKDTKEEKLRNKLLGRVEKFKELKFGKEARVLAKEYIKQNIIPEAFPDDAYHIAIATVNRMDYLVSWNFKLKGYPNLEIIAPPEL